MDMNEIKEIFFQECEEQLAELESGLLRLNDGDRDPETVNAVFRAVHSIKGGAGAFGLDDLVSFAHVFETTLDCVRSNRLEPTQDVLKVMLKSADVLADLTNCARDGGSVDQARSKQLIRELEALANGEVPAASEAPAAKPAPAPKAAAPMPVAAPKVNEEGFQPIPFSFDDFGGEVPRTMDDLLTLNGVARKTANVVLGNAFGIASGVVVDTHVARLSHRLGLTDEKTPEKIEKDLAAVLG